MGEYVEPYDAAKAHEYYLRTRKLKGRAPAAPKPPLKSVRPGSHAVPVKGKRIGQQASKAVKSSAQLRSEAHAKVAAIKARISKLEAALKELMNEAATSKAKSAEKKSSSPKSSSSDMTASEKAKKSRENKDYYDKHKKPAEPKDPAKMTTEEKITEVKKQLSQARAQLQAAMSGSSQSTTQPANGKKAVVNTQGRR